MVFYFSTLALQILVVEIFSCVYETGLVLEKTFFFQIEEKTSEKKD